MTKTSGATPAGRRASLTVRMSNAAREAGVVPRRIHLVVAIDGLLVRLLQAAPGQWVVKGGYANQLRRPDDARFTEDLDLRIDAAIETAPELLAPWTARSSRRAARTGCAMRSSGSVSSSSDSR